MMFPHKASFGIGDASITQFADDLWKIKICNDYKKVKITINRMAERLDGELVKRKYSQNLEKLVILPELGPKGNRWLYEHHNGSYQVQCSHRHLGIQYMTSHSNSSEITLRIKGMNRGWGELRGFWHSNAPWRVKMLCYRLRVQSAGYSGLTAICPTVTELKRLDVSIGKKLRSLLSGRACDMKSGEGEEN